MLAEDLPLVYGSPLVVAALLAIPVWRMLSRVGLSPNWTVLLAVPAIGIALALAVLAFAPWPRIEGRATVAPASPPPPRPWGEAPRPATAKPAPRTEGSGAPRESWRRGGTVERRRRD